MAVAIKSYIHMPLIDSDTWTAKFIGLKQLQFHPANPRLPELRGKVSEREIIHELCNRGTVDSLARDVAEKGYFRNDRLIVLRENGKNVVYEGNRRLCALKVLDDPSLAPLKMQKLFKKYSDKAKLPKKIAVEIVPSKFDAEIVMYSKHAASRFVVGWDPIQQSTFIAAKLDGGSTIDELCSECGLKRDEVINARASVDLYRLSRLATLTPEAQKLVDDPALFPYSTVFERLFKPKKCRGALGVDIKESGMVIESTEEKFLPVLARILDDAANEKINTRKLGTEDEQIAYVKKLKFTPGGGSFTVEDVEQRRKGKEGKLSPSASIASAVQPQTKGTKASGKFLPKSLSVAYHHPKITKLIEKG